MYLKLTVLIVFGTLLAAGLVMLRQQRLDAAHAMAELHHQIDLSRQAMWNMQADIANHTDPQALRQALVKAQLTMEPLTQPPPANTANTGHAKHLRLAAESHTDVARE